MIRIGILLVWFLLSMLYGIPSRLSILLGIIVLLLSGLSFLFDRQGFGLRLTTYAFGFLVVGLITYIREVKNEKN